VTYAFASVVLALGLAFVVWPLVRHREPDRSDPADQPRRVWDGEEVELDLATGRISAAEAAARISEASRR
jgi:hypothetical protein